MKKMMFISFLLLGQNCLYSAAGFNEYALPYDLATEMAAFDALLDQGAMDSRIFWGGGGSVVAQEGYGERFFHHTFQIIPTTQLTAEQLTQAQRAYAEGYFREYPEQTVEQYSDEFNRFLLSCRMNPSKNFSFTVLMDDRAVGTVFGQLLAQEEMGDPTVMPGSRAGEISSIVVDHQFKNSGIGKMLLTAVFQAYPLVQYWYAISYDESRLFYQKNGFKPNRWLLEKQGGTQRNLHVRKDMF